MKASFFTVLYLIAISLFFSVQSLGADKTEIVSAEIQQKQMPLIIGQPTEDLFNIFLHINALENDPLVLDAVQIDFDPGCQFNGLSSLVVKNTIPSLDNRQSSEFGSSTHFSDEIIIRGNYQLKSGLHFLKFDFILSQDPDLLTRFRIKKVKLLFKNHAPLILKNSEKFIFRPAMVLRAKGQDKANTYRIPGLITTNKGTLIAVYDIRYNGSKDLQENIDIGMSRSTDGGKTWQPMKVIMDMGKYGGRPQDQNGIGDPCILVDPLNNTIWVAALWMSGPSPKESLWEASKPGLDPETTGQFMLVKSTDDGLTWSAPASITPQVKDQSWQLFFQCPGRGISLSDGTLVFPAEFKADIGVQALDGGQYTSHSTIVYSQDQGSTWHVGSGAKPNTSEAQVVQLTDGSLMINMRDDHNRTDKGKTNGRAVAVSTDLGKTWKIHPTSNKALPEPHCMASLISVYLPVKDKIQQVLFFSNPNDKTKRDHLTIKASLTQGNTWPKSYQVELYSESGNGYSCLTMIDSQTIGILYEGTHELYFQKIPVSDVLGNLVR